MSAEERVAREAALGEALFLLAKASAEYAGLPAAVRNGGPVNPALIGELLQIMEDSAGVIARVLLEREERSP